MLDKAEVTFTESERAALRDVMIDWINEQVMRPPYPPELASVIEKLGLSDYPAIEQLDISTLALRPNLE